jgi:hypothetical protein
VKAIVQLEPAAAAMYQFERNGVSGVKDEAWLFAIVIGCVPPQAVIADGTAELLQTPSQIKSPVPFVIEHVPEPEVNVQLVAVPGEGLEASADRQKRNGISQRISYTPPSGWRISLLPPS